MASALRGRRHFCNLTGRHSHCKVLVSCVAQSGRKGNVSPLLYRTNKTRNVSVDIMDRILQEFEQSLMAGDWISQGGVDFARAALERAVGPRKAQEILERVTSKVSSGFYMLINVAPDQIAPFISHEHPQTIALIRPYSLAIRSGSRFGDPLAVARTPTGRCSLSNCHHGEDHTQCH